MLRLLSVTGNDGSGAEHPPGTHEAGNPAVTPDQPAYGRAGSSTPASFAPGRVMDYLARARNEITMSLFANFP
jgi:hypothetical protein